MTGAFGKADPGRPPAASLDDFRSKLQNLGGSGRGQGGHPTPRPSSPGRSQDAPRTTPQDAPESFSKSLAQASGGKDRPGILPGNPANRPTDPMSVRSNSLSAMDRLKSMVAARMPGQDSRTPVQDAKTPPKTVPKGTFVAGQKPTPTGPTKHEVMNTPKHQERLKAVVAEHESKNPGKKLMGPGLMSLWNDKHPDLPLNNARAGRIAQAVNAARDAHAQSKVAGYMRTGASKTMKGS